MSQSDFERDVLILLDTINQNLVAIGALIAWQDTNPDIRRWADIFAPPFLKRIKRSPISSSVLKEDRMATFKRQFYKNKHPFKKSISRQANRKVPDGVGFRSIHKNGQPIVSAPVGFSSKCSITPFWSRKNKIMEVSCNASSA